MSDDEATDVAPQAAQLPEVDVIVEAGVPYLPLAGRVNTVCTSKTALERVCRRVLQLERWHQSDAQDRVEDARRYDENNAFHHARIAELHRQLAELPNAVRPKENPETDFGVRNG